MTESRLDSLTEALRSFADERDWPQFHSPRNLAFALASEVGELCGELRWLTDQEVEDGLASTLKQRLSSEAADVFTFLIYFAESIGVDLVEASMAKLEANKSRYPTSKAYGNARKYTDLK